jgi:hypothetical protein
MATWSNTGEETPPSARVTAFLVYKVSMTWTSSSRFILSLILPCIIKNSACSVNYHGTLQFTIRLYVISVDVLLPVGHDANRVPSIAKAASKSLILVEFLLFSK